jgi:hypothetical protein
VGLQEIHLVINPEYPVFPGSLQRGSPFSGDCFRNL